MLVVLACRHSEASGGRESASDNVDGSLNAHLEQKQHPVNGRDPIKILI